ncbi:formylglycine-generating enzyme required for sulfatase activity [Desulfobotulus alkaliphilus]|uniref:Formylglycine-generating enzyme required for sulfatase activity n=1 Tax=Desulfobotulus alkaliphilus TaxID=622671 RepID=A0A562R4A6_9BACT|nr:formylglycine-generating enzyme family protein [Desulfobotulus alkaliphilus]TWI63912.1 formylglycine-generating enzyme required for sulfatase activity [Desulfobotulus alkaliphilus]
MEKIISLFFKIISLNLVLIILVSCSSLQAFNPVSVLDKLFPPTIYEEIRDFRPGEGSFSSNEPRITNSLGMTFVRIPAGTFWMGSPHDEPARYDNEELHQVEITMDFYIMTTEVTQAQWEAVMGNNPSYFKDCGPDCPVEQVSWEDVHVFIQKLNKMDKTLVVRLPTEAEWEYAARAGTNTPFAFGPCLSTNQANYAGGLPMSGCPTGKNRKTPIKTASLEPNAWGLYDMHGNVWEWVMDIYREDYENLPRVNPFNTKGSGVIVRGGSWSNYAGNCRSANRITEWTGKRSKTLGFRLAGQ